MPSEHDFPKFRRQLTKWSIDCWKFGDRAGRAKGDLTGYLEEGRAGAEEAVPSHGPVSSSVEAAGCWAAVCQQPDTAFSHLHIEECSHKGWVGGDEQDRLACCAPRQQFLQHLQYAFGTVQSFCITCQGFGHYSLRPSVPASGHFRVNSYRRRLPLLWMSTPRDVQCEV